jgi:hypothetical protein
MYASIFDIWRTKLKYIYLKILCLRKLSSFEIHGNAKIIDRDNLLEFIYTWKIEEDWIQHGGRRGICPLPM